MHGFKTVTLNPYDPDISSDVDRVRGAQCRTLFAYWQNARGDAEAPDWSRFDFMDLYDIAPSMIVFDIDETRKAANLRYRFMGTKIVEYRAYRDNPDLTGLTFADGQRAYDPAPMEDAYDGCIQAGHPVLMRGEYRTEVSWGEHERLILPWTIDGVVMRMTTVLDRHEIG